jgi:ketosteroid isomerase-like protein
MTHKLALVAGAAMLFALAACQQAAPVDTAKEEAAINAQIDVLNAGMKAKDADKVVSIDADDVKGYGGGPDTSGKAQDLANNKAGMADPAYAGAVKVEHTEVAKSGDIAFQTGTWDFTGTNPSTKAVEHTNGHWVAGWRKDKDGSWKLAAVSAANGAPPPAAAAAPAAAPAADAKPAAAPAKK